MWHRFLTAFFIGFLTKLIAAPISPSSSPGPFSPIKLYSPKPAADNYFGAENYFFALNRKAHLWRNSFLELAGAKLAVIDPFYDEERGAVHIFDIKTGRLIDSVYGDQPGNLLGSGGLFKLANGNFLISSPYDDEPTKNFLNNGSLKLYDLSEKEVTATLRGNSSWELIGSLDAPTAPTRDFIAISKSGKIVIASPMANFRAGRLQILNPLNLSVLKSINGAAGNQLGSGGLLNMKLNDIVVAGSPLVTHPSCQNCGQITFLDTAKNDIAALYPFWGNFYIETLWPNVRMGSGEMKELPDGSLVVSNMSDSAKGIKNVGSLAAINWKLRPYSDCLSGAAARNKNFHSNSAKLITGSLENDQFGFANIITGESAITVTPTNGILVGSPNLKNANKVKTGVAQLFDYSLNYKGGISGAFADDRFGEKIISLTNGNFVALTPLMDAQSVGNPIKNIGMTYLLNQTNLSLIKMLYQGIENLRVGLSGALELSNGDFVYDNGNKISIASSTTGAEKRSLNIKANVGAEGPKASAFASLSSNRFAVLSVRTNDANRSGNGGVYFINVKTRNIENSVFQDSLAVNLGQAGMHVLSTGELLIFNPTDSSRGISNAGSIWIVPLNRAP